MATTTLPDLLEKMWKDYTTMNPQALKIYNLFLERGDQVQNDHIALRTFNHPKVTIDVLAIPFLESGYEYRQDYHFTAKKLYAKHYEHPDGQMPKIFISELKLEEFDNELQDIVNQLIDQVPDYLTQQFEFCSNGRPWEVSNETYEQLRTKSEYAAWMAAHGYRPNHFTVFVNALNSFSDIREVNEFIKQNGFKMNDSGGEVKGSKDVYLEQSSTLADTVEVNFSDGTFAVPACYYEFAQRYPQSSGELYQGFVANSADKIFESTNKSQ
ncbi:DUF1338 domain-containing protein [Tunicatimonas pelagia]|uniref:DUF1338 domain-containing protein n=1 Tax=Tunicatimonas pelagia TaxID=931531 RepID=UPI002666E629|nr:DUF1338 domain-containing protein [Tunicatimonas pelagia]WKN45765.1 DUF1338 domain-containing protein [Tunicatimonas pelagia]